MNVGGMAIHTLDWLSSCAETIRCNATSCHTKTAKLRPGAPDQIHAKRFTRQGRKARTVLVLLLDMRRKRLLRRQTANKGELQWDVFSATVDEGQTLCEAATSGLHAALPQLAQVACLSGLDGANNAVVAIDSFRVPACKAEAFVFQLQAEGEAAVALLDAPGTLSWAPMTEASEQASWRLRQSLSRSDFDRCLPVMAETFPQFSKIEEETVRGETQHHKQGIELLELYCGNGNHTVAMSGVFDR